MSLVLSSETPIDRKFSQQIKRRELLEVFADLYLSPISLDFVVDSMPTIENRRIGGVFHLSGSVELSYAELAHRLAKKLDRASDMVRETTATKSATPVLYRPQHPSLGMDSTFKTLEIL